VKGKDKSKKEVFSMMDINQYLYLPTWEEIEEELEKEVNFMELFNSDKVVEYSIDLYYNDKFVELELDEFIEVLDDYLIFKILEKSFDFFQIEIILKDDLTEKQIERIYDLQKDKLYLEAYENVIYLQISFINKKEILDLFNELYKILHK
jgi:hypothetical protein